MDKERRYSGQWILCSERLPEDGQRVLISTVDLMGSKTVELVSYGGNNRFELQPGLGYFYWYIPEGEFKGPGPYVVAWMPAPKGYGSMAGQCEVKDGIDITEPIFEQIGKEKNS